MNTHDQEKPIQKRLYKSTIDKMVTGVLAGIAEYFNTDPTIIRIIFIAVLLITGFFPGFFAYIIAYFIIPDRPMSAYTNHSQDEMPFLKTEPSEITTDKTY